MKNKKYLKIVPGIVTTLLLIAFLTTLSVKPWARKKIEAALNNKNSDYTVTIDKISTSIIPSGIELEGINICTKEDYRSTIDLKGEIGSIKLKGIKLLKAIFKKDICIRKVTISNSDIKINIPFPEESVPPVISPLNVRIARILIDKTDLIVGNTSTAQSYAIKEGVLKMNDLQIEKQDTLSPGIVKQFDFEAEELVSVSSDSMYSFIACNIAYFATSNSFKADSFSIQPNYKDYDFTSRHEYQTSRIESGFSNLNVHNFNAADYFQTGNLTSSYIEIGRMDMKVFRDKRKELRHVNKPAFQDMIYNYPSIIRIDSICLTKGNVIYTDHAEGAKDPGNISFNKINAEIYNITNDNIYKSQNDSLELKGDALLMGKARMTISLKGRLFDSLNTFSLNGTLSSLEANELNPILEKSAFIYATSGKIDSMNFSFTADNTKATGKLTILYHGLYIAVKNKRTDDTTAFRERFISLIANRKVFDSNPILNKEVREGIIDNERDPEKFLFSYCFKSILSGIISSLVKNPKKRKN